MVTAKALGLWALPASAGAYRLWLAGIVVLHHLLGWEFGKIPVLVFFSLSGYWVHHVWFQEYAGTRAPILTFLASRWLRIAPLLALASALSTLVLILVSDTAAATLRADWVNLLLSSIFALGFASLNLPVLGPAWSLELEMQFYLLAPLLLPVVRRVASLRALLLALAAMVLAWNAGTSLWWLLTGPFFFFGMCAAQCRWRMSRSWASGCAVSGALLVVAAIVSPWHGLFIDPDAPWANAFAHGVALLFLPAALASVAPAQAKDAELSRVPQDRMLGDMSYAVYLLHWPLILLLRSGIWDGAEAIVAGAVLLGIVLPVVSLIAWRWIDLPVNRARRAWVRSRRVVGREEGIPVVLALPGVT